MSPASVNQVLFQWLSVPDAAGFRLVWLSALAQWPVFAVPVLLAGLWLLGNRRDREAAVAAGMTCCVALAAAQLVAMTVDHPRPFMVGLAANTLGHAPDSSFPSDHATLLFACAAAFGFGSVPRWRWLGLATAALGLATGWARVALGVHFPFDILGAAIVAGLADRVVATTATRPLRALMTIGEAIRQRVPRLRERRSTRTGSLAGCDAHPHR